MKKRIIALTKQSLILFTLSTVIFLFSSCGFFVSEKHILTSVSPDKSYTLEAVLVDGGATTAYSVKVYSVNDNLLFNKKQIYSKYREDNVEINWIDNSTVDINGVILDLEKNETFQGSNQFKTFQNVNRIWYQTAPPWVDADLPSLLKPNF